jgi:hypothetical protein
MMMMKGKRMNQVSDEINQFFSNFEKAINQPDQDLLASRYADVFMFANAQGVQAVQKVDFMKVLPRRQTFFHSIGLISTTIHRIEETRMDNSYIMVKVFWLFHFEKVNRPPIIDENPATYLLHQQNDQLSIVFQLDHQDLMQRAIDLGFLQS